MAGVADRQADSVTAYLELIFNEAKKTSGLLCYRGQANSAWELRPSVMRGLKRDAENGMFSELVLDAPNEFNSDRCMFDKLVRAQHYGLPTRLLDVSLNPLAALYFACNENDTSGKDGMVFTFAFKNERVKFADSDAVSLICNLSRLSDDERQEIASYYWGTYKKEASPKPGRFRALRQMKRLTQFVRVEKPYFLDAARPSDLFRYYFVHPVKSNARLIAQSGAFVAAGLLAFNKPEKSDGFSLNRIIIPHAKKQALLKELDALNVNSRSMFPEIGSASKYIRDKWSDTK